MTSAKSYGPDVLTVQQLAECIKKAGQLDEKNEKMEADRAAYLAYKSEVDQSKGTIDSQQERVDRSSKPSVRAFNSLVDRHNKLVLVAKAKQDEFNLNIDTQNNDINSYNAQCVKKYYASDLSDAQKLASGN